MGAVYVTVAVQLPGNVNPMLSPCWIDVFDAGPAWRHHWSIVNLRCHLGSAYTNVLTLEALN